MRSPLLSFGLLFRVWPEAAAVLDERVRRASLGFCPLQRTKLRKSTHPGFPSPGMFPSRRFSRPQGLTPSETARACSIPLPLLGFRLQDPPLAGDALAGRLLGMLDPPVLPHPKAQAAVGAARATGPEGPRRPRGTDEPQRRARLRPWSPLADRQARRRDKILMAARTSSEPSSLRPCPASRAHLSDPSWCQPEGRPRVGQTSCGRRVQAPEGAGSSEARSLDRTVAIRAVDNDPGKVGRGEPRPVQASSRPAVRKRKACFQLGPHRTSAPS